MPVTAVQTTVSPGRVRPSGQRYRFKQRAGMGSSEGCWVPLALSSSLPRVHCCSAPPRYPPLITQTSPRCWTLWSAAGAMLSLSGRVDLPGRRRRVIGSASRTGGFPVPWSRGLKRSASVCSTGSGWPTVRVASRCEGPKVLAVRSSKPSPSVAVARSSANAPRWATPPGDRPFRVGAGTSSSTTRSPSRS